MANQNENHTVSIFVDVVSKLSSYIKYYFQIVTVLNFQQSIIMNIINSPKCHLKSGDGLTGDIKFNPLYYGLVSTIFVLLLNGILSKRIHCQSMDKKYLAY